MDHAKFSPSGASRWLRCPGSISLEALAPKEVTSVHAQEGTDAHTLAELLLRVRLAEQEPIDIKERDSARAEYQKHLAYCEDEAEWLDMRIHVQEYVDNILKAAEGGELHVEVKLDTSDAIGVPDQFGTSDAVIVKDTVLEVHDLKYGKGVRVDAEHNEQAMTYALGALDMFDILGEIETVKMVIHQVRLGDISEWECSVNELRTFANDLKRAAKMALSAEPPFYAGEKQCRWCKGKAICQHAASHVTDVAIAPAEADEFADLTVAEFVQAMPVEQFENYYDKVGFVEDWAKAIRARAHIEAMNGTLTRYKAVTGRAGARKWADADEAEAMMKSMRLKQDEMYAKTPISPTVAEKLLKKDSPKRWKRLEPLITKPDGKPTVVPIDDKRLAITNSATEEEFDDLDSEIETDDLA
jgi:CRISPR/Cas system-associated exonuclease Cas4 (RecB family)